MQALFNLYRNYGIQEALNIAPLGGEEKSQDKAAYLLSKNKLLLGAILGTVLSAAIGLSTLLDGQFEGRAEVIAHRGASASAPENTLAAVKQAIIDQADWVEIDVQETVDGDVVVFHDSDFMKLANSDLKIWDATRKELAQVDIGSHFEPRFSVERVPTLRQVLASAKGKRLF